MEIEARLGYMRPWEKEEGEKKGAGKGRGWKRRRTRGRKRGTKREEGRNTNRSKKDKLYWDSVVEDVTQW